MPELMVYIRSHHYVIRQITPRGRPAIEVFARRFVQWTMQRVAPGRFERAPARVFGAATKSRSEYRFHINTLPAFKQHLIEHYLKDDMVHFINEPMYTPDNETHTVQEHWEVRDYQQPVIDYILEKNHNFSKFISLATGRGKLQPLDAKIKVPGGWSTMGEMYVGKEITAWDGTTTAVTAIHPHGQKEVFKVTFADGRSTECGEEHLWEVFYINASPDKRWKVIDTKEMLRLISMPSPRIYIRLIRSEMAPELKLPIDPYTLGILLGDGSFNSVGLTITKNDLFIFDEIEKSLPNTLRLSKPQFKQSGARSHRISLNREVESSKNIYVDSLREFGLHKKLSHEKFIPDQYLHGSSYQRLSILQGLLDTDGTVSTDGHISFCSTSEELAKGVQYLVRSLGGIAKIRSRYTYYTHNEEKKRGRLSYHVNIRHPKPSLLFRLPRKLERTNDNNQYSSILKLRVKSIESIGFKETQCITVAHPDHLYVTDDFIVTHNSFVSMTGISAIGQRVLIYVKPMYIDKWVEDMMRTYSMDINDVAIVKGSGALMQLQSLAHNHLLDAKVILISNKTMQSYLKLYEEVGDEIINLGYACVPEQFCELLKVGIRLIDEVHQDFHLNFKLDLYTHVPLSISLSATLLSDDDFINRMYEIAYPAIDRYKGDAQKKYIAVKAVVYRFKYPNKIRTKDYGSKTYSHHVLEKSILRSPEMTNNYMKMVHKLLESSYFINYQPGQKALIFCASIDLATRLSEYLKKTYYNLDVRRYVQEDEYNDLINSDICISTLLSSGTAVDIPNLSTVIMTTAISSSAANVQALGRLRELKDGTTPEFLYLVSEDVPKHMEYHERKRILFNDRAATQKTVFVGEPV